MPKSFKVSLVRIMTVARILELRLPLQTASLLQVPLLFSCGWPSGGSCRDIRVPRLRVSRPYLKERHDVHIWYQELSSLRSKRQVAHRLANQSLLLKLL